MKSIALNPHPRKALATILLSTVIFITACSESTPTSDDTNFNAYIQQAQSYLETNQFKAAFSSANNAVKEAPTKIDGYLMLAKINGQSGHPQHNIDLLTAYKGAKNSEYNFILLNAYQESGKLISAQKLMDQELTKLQEQPQRLKLAQAKQLLYKKQWQQAKTAFKELAKNPDYEVESLLALAKIEASTNNSDNAIALSDNILEIDPKNTEALFLKSIIYYQKQDINNTEKMLSEALGSLPTTDIFTPQRIQIIQSLINVLTQQGRSSEAMIYTRVLSEEFPAAEPITLQYSRAVELFENQQFSASKVLLLEILENAPQHKKASTLLGLILYKEGDPENAEKYLADIVDPEVSPLKLTELYIAAQLKQNKSENVLSLLEYIPEGNRNADTWVLYGNAAILQNKFADAKMALDKAKALDDKSLKVILLENYYYNSLPEPQPETALQLLSTALSSNAQSEILQNAYLRQLISLNKVKQADDYAIYLQENHASNMKTQLIVANYYVYKREIATAKAVLEKVLATESENIYALSSMAKINSITSDWEAALNNYNKIINLSPSDIIAYKGAVISLIRLQKDPLNAAQYLPKNYQASLLALTLSSLTLQQGKLDLATNYAQEAVNELPTQYQSSLNELTLQLNLKKAINSFVAKDYAQARQLVLSEIQTSPKDTRLLSLLVHIEIASNQYDEAQKITQQISELLPNDPLSTLLKAEILTAKGDVQQATTLLNAYWLETKNQQVAEKLYLQLQNQDAQKASAFLDEWQSEFPNSLLGLRHKAIFLQNNGKTQQAILVYENILKQDKNDIVSLNNAAWLYSLQNNPRATILAKQAYQLNPNDGAIADTYGWILFNNGDKAQGRALIEKASKLLPNDPNIKDHYDVVTQS